MAGFDWYQATVPAPVNDVLEALGEGLGARRLVHGRGRHSFAHSTALEGPEGKLGEVLHGGTQEYPHVLFSGDATQAGVEVIRPAFPLHYVTRADARVDFEDADAFERIKGVMLATAEQRRIAVNCAGDWALTNAGRTLYLGSPSSAVRERLYDKAAQLRARFAKDPARLAEVPEHLSRLEAQVRPQTREARERFAAIEPLEVMGSARWLREVWQGVAGTELRPVQVGKVWRQADHDRAWAYMLAQYRGTLLRKLEDHGSPAAVGCQIFQDLAERERKRKG